MQLIQSLKEYGLSEKEAVIYRALLEHGSATATALSNSTGIKRSTCYDILSSLLNRGLISETRKGTRRLFIAKKPEKLLDNLRDKERLLLAMLPELQILWETKATKPKISFREGESGLWDVYEEILKYQGEIQAFLATTDEARIAGFNVVDEYIRKRVSKGIYMRAVMPKTNGAIRRYVRKDKEQLRKTKLISAKKYPFSVEINIYSDNKVAIMSVRDMIGITIESKEIHNTFKSIFELLWDNLPAYKTTRL